MKISYIVLGLIVAPAFAESQTVADRTAWLNAHTAPIRSIDFSDTAYDDLAPLGRAIGNRRVVFLGEQGHGDGATFEAKSRVIRYLHERRGFDMLVFESGFYDCRRTWNDAKAGLALADSAINCMFELWSNSEQVRPLLRYIDTEKRSPHPLEIAGMDFQPSGRRGALLVEDLGRFLAAQKDTSGTGALLNALSTTYGYIVAPATRPPNISKAAGDSLQQTLMSAVERFRSRPLHDVPALGSLGEADFWTRAVGGAGALVGFMKAIVEAGPNSLPAGGILNRRDSVMGENIAWLASRYPNRKIIVWGATSHFVRNRTGITNDPAPNMVPAGHVASQRLPGQTYSIAFLGGEGEQGTARRGSAPPSPIPPPDSASLDGMLLRTGLNFAFLDLRSIPSGGGWLEAPLVARPLGYGAMASVWPNHVDAFFFIRRMTPSTPVVTQSARP